MKKIAFFVQHMLCGGVENALITLSNELYRAGNDVTVYVIEKNGEFIHRLPEGVKVEKIPMPKRLAETIPVGGSKLSIRRNVRGHHYFRALVNIYQYFWGGSGFAELNINFEGIPKLEESYDIAVNFHMHSPFLVRYLDEKVSAEKKFTWIHNDFTTTRYDIKKLNKYLECCDGFYCVSEKLRKEFIQIFPKYITKTKTMYNIVPVDEILKKSKELAPEFEDISEGIIKFLSVGRLEDQKGYDLTISVCKKLLDQGYKFKWIILGEGTERKKLEELIKKNQLEKVLFLLGVRLNPYPYFKSCDLYIQTSKHEGYVTTVTEAKIFNKPIVCTDVSGAREQIEDGKNGYVAKHEVEDICKKIQWVIEKDFCIEETMSLRFDKIRDENLNIFR